VPRIRSRTARNTSQLTVRHAAVESFNRRRATGCLYLRVEVIMKSAQDPPTGVGWVRRDSNGVR